MASERNVSAAPDGLSALPESPPDRIANLEAEVSEIKQLIKKQMAGQPVKGQYLVSEAAELTGYEQWTIRQACNKGRIKATKGDDGRWRVPHQELVRLQERGLPAE
ncbi:MAG: helix-turn-helix domain-containing protein [Planctomycetota bacterium]